MRISQKSDVSSKDPSKEVSQKETDQQLDLQKINEEPKKEKVISEEVPEDTTLKDRRTDQTGSMRYEEETENKLSSDLQNQHLKDLQMKNEELQNTGEALKTEFQRRGSKNKEIELLLKKLQGKGEVLKNEIKKLISKNKHSARAEIRKSITKTDNNTLKDDKPTTNKVGTDQTDSIDHKEDAENTKVCNCRRYCKEEDLKIVCPSVMIKMIQGAPKDPIYHTIKWVGEIRRNRGRLWREYLDILWKKEVHPELEGSKWGWLSKVLKPQKYDKEENLDCHLFKLPALKGMVSSELETISNLAFQIKYQNAEIRATKRLLTDQVLKIESKYTAEITISKRMRKRDLITYKF